MLQALLARWPDHPRVDLVTTDGFLFPNATLEARGLMARKGFPESYDVRALMRFLAELKAGAPKVHAPRYSHLTYDIVDDEEIDPHVARHRHRRGRERVADAVAPRSGRRRASSSPTSSTSRSTSTPTRPISNAGTSTGSCSCGRRRCTTRARTSTSSRSTTEEATREFAQSVWNSGQPREPPREHRADARPSASRAREERRSRDRPRPPAQALVGDRASVRCARRAGRTTRAPRSIAQVDRRRRRRRDRATPCGRPTPPCRRSRWRASAAARRARGSR